MRIRNYGIALLTTVFAISTKAETLNLIYINGISNTQIDAEITRRQIETRAELSEVSNSDELIVSNIWNPIGWNDAPDIFSELNEDLNELVVTKTNEERFALDFGKLLTPHDAIGVRAFVSDEAERVAEYVVGELESFANPIQQAIASVKEAIEEDEIKTVIVAHSQGNLIANYVWAAMLSGEVDFPFRSLRVVNVANTSLFSANSLNATHENDAALFRDADSAMCPEASLETLPVRMGWERQTAICSDGSGPGICNFLVAEPTFVGFEGGDDRGIVDQCLNHGMVTTYMSDSQVEILQDNGVQFRGASISALNRFEDIVDEAYRSLSAYRSKTIEQPQSLLTPEVDEERWISEGFGGVAGSARWPNTAGVVFAFGNFYFENNNTIQLGFFRNQGNGWEFLETFGSGTQVLVSDSADVLLGRSGVYWTVDDDGNTESVFLPQHPLALLSDSKVLLADQSVFDFSSESMVEQSINISVEGHGDDGLIFGYQNPAPQGDFPTDSEPVWVVRFADSSVDIIPCGVWNDDVASVRCRFSAANAVGGIAGEYARSTGERGLVTYSSEGLVFSPIENIMDIERDFDSSGRALVTGFSNSGKILIGSVGAQDCEVGHLIYDNGNMFPIKPLVPRHVCHNVSVSMSSCGDVFISSQLQGLRTFLEFGDCD